MARLKSCKRIKVPTLSVRYLGTTVRVLKFIRFSLLHSIRNLREVLSGVIVCWLSTSDTMRARIRPNWDSWALFATYVYNTTEHSVTGFTPFELLFGRPSTLPSALKKPTELQYNYDDYASELKGRLQTVHQHAHKNLVESKGKSNEH